MAMTDQEVHLAWDEIIVGMDAGTASDKQAHLALIKVGHRKKSG